MPNTIYDTFESYECPKCSGQRYIHGFSHVANGVCFLCSGAGHKFTRRGQRDYHAWRAAVDALVTRPVTDVTPGVHVQLSGFAKYHKVSAIERPVQLGYGTVVNGETVWAQCYRLTFERPVSIASPVGRITEQTWEVEAATVRIHPGADLMPKARDFDSRYKTA